MTELNSALEYIKKGKAASWDCIPDTILKLDSRVMKDIILRAINKFLESGKVDE